VIASLGETLSDWSERYVPSPFSLALVLSLLTFGLGLAFGRDVASQPLMARVGTLADGWFAGFYGTAGLTFALQMCIVLITGHALATSAPIQRGIHRLAEVASEPRDAAFVVAIVACAASLIQWGLGAIVGAFMAREMGRAFEERGESVHYPLLGAAGYAGFLVWHGGFSGSAPLKVAESGHFVEDAIGVVPVSETLLSPLNLAILGSLLVAIPMLFRQLMPSNPSEMREPDLSGEGDDTTDDADETTHGSTALEWLEGTPTLNIVAGVMGFAFLGYYFGGKGVAGWHLNSINLLFLTLGLYLYATPSAYVEAIRDGVQGAAGIILQFPFYFGILGVLKASGLIQQVAEFFIGISSQTTFPIFAFLSAGIVNFFVPSGGGQWAVQGEIMMQAANSLDVPIHKAIMAFSYGDAWTNMLQPFWALPLLGIMDLEARDIIGYTALVMFVTGPVIVTLLVLL
jgi:short-chain fatty acids transporter